jgi:hypothetical protein
MDFLDHAFEIFFDGRYPRGEAENLTLPALGCTSFSRLPESRERTGPA